MKEKDIVKTLENIRTAARKSNDVAVIRDLEKIARSFLWHMADPVLHDKALDICNEISSIRVEKERSMKPLTKKLPKDIERV